MISLGLGLMLSSMLVQIAAAWCALRIHRIAGRPAAWVLMSLALVLMALRRLVVLEEYLRRGLPEFILLNEGMSLAISILLLAGVIAIRGIFVAKAAQAAAVAEAQEGMLAQADRLAAIMAATPVPIWIAEDPSCRVIGGNPAAAALFEPSEEAVAPAPGPSDPEAEPFRLLREGCELLPGEMPLQRAAAGEEIHDLPLDLVFQHGETRRLIFHAMPLRDPEGRVQGAVACAADVTDMRRTQEALAKAQKMESLGMLSGGIAHDFNNIFQAMVANLEMAQAAVPAESRGQIYLQRLKDGLERASGLSRDILHSSGGDLRRPESVNLTALAAETLDRMGVRVIRDFSMDMPRVLADPVLLGRVVEGLVANALEASPAGGGVRVRTGLRAVTPGDLGKGHWPEPLSTGIYAILEVSDQGHGIDADTLRKVFDPFFSTRDLGRGLGLAAALGIVRGHRGGIQVESIPEVGSVFRVYLPSPEGQETLAVPPQVEARARNLVLLADDEAELRAVMAEMLQDWFGLEVLVAADGQEALEAFSLRPEAFDLVLLDASMPRLGGVEAFRAMRALRPGVPGILCSGYALPASRDQAIAQGFADFLKKPFTSAELEALLDRVLGSPSPSPGA